MVTDLLWERPSSLPSFSWVLCRKLIHSLLQQSLGLPATQKETHMGQTDTQVSREKVHFVLINLKLFRVTVEHSSPYISSA